MEFKGIYVIIATLIIVAALFVGLAVVDDYSAADNPYNMKQIDSYLFECEVQDLDYDYAYEFFENKTVTNGQSSDKGGCTSFVKNGLLGRSYDWQNDNASTIVMHIKGAKYDSLNVVSFGDMTKQNCTDIVDGTNNQTDLMRIAPFNTLDGTNDAGLTCESNVVPTDDANPSSVAAVETREKIPYFMLVRYCLDNFDDAKKAAEYLRDYCDVYCADNIALHILITDKTGQAYIVEFMDGKTVINDHPMMTNFYITGVHFKEDGTVPTPISDEGKVTELSNITAHGDGLERYNIVATDYDNLNSVSDFFTTLHKVRYTNTYKPETNPMWCSEVFLDNNESNLTVDSPVSDFNGIFDIFHKKYLNHEIMDLSLHQDVWDINNGVLYLEVREQNICHEFKLNG